MTNTLHILKVGVCIYLVWALIVIVLPNLIGAL